MQILSLKPMDSNCILAHKTGPVADNSKILACYNKSLDLVYYEQHGIGRAKYTVSFHDGLKFHDDGSPFFDIRIFASKKKLGAFVDSLKLKGFKGVVL